MKAYVFPGQGSQKPGMGQNLYNKIIDSRALFKKANEILNFDITELMFEGTSEDLLQTRVTQPAIFIHSVILALQPNHLILMYLLVTLWVSFLLLLHQIQ